MFFKTPFLTAFGPSLRIVGGIARKCMRCHRILQTGIPAGRPRLAPEPGCGSGWRGVWNEIDSHCLYVKIQTRHIKYDFNTIRQMNTCRKSDNRTQCGYLHQEPDPHVVASAFHRVSVRMLRHPGEGSVAEFKRPDSCNGLSANFHIKVFMHFHTRQFDRASHVIQKNLFFSTLHHSAPRNLVAGNTVFLHISPGFRQI